MTRQKPTSAHGYHSKCACCPTLVWVDTTHGEPPGPDLCSQECYDKYHSRPYFPAWAFED